MMTWDSDCSTRDLKVLMSFRFTDLTSTVKVNCICQIRIELTFSD